MNSLNAVQQETDFDDGQESPMELYIREGNIEMVKSVALEPEEIQRFVDDFMTPFLMSLKDPDGRLPPAVVTMLMMVASSVYINTQSRHRAEPVDLQIELGHILQGIAGSFNLKNPS